MSAKLSGDFWKEDCTIAGRSYSPTLNPVHLLTSPFDPACLCSCCRCSKYFPYLAPHRMGWRWRHKSAGKLPQILANGKFSRPEIPLWCDFWGELPSPEYSPHPKFACWVLIPKGRLCKQCKDKSPPKAQSASDLRHIPPQREMKKTSDILYPISTNLTTSMNLPSNN